MSDCTNKPGCECRVCQAPSAKQDQDRAAWRYITKLRAERIRAARRNGSTVTHNIRGILCEGCWNYESNELKKGKP